MSPPHAERNYGTGSGAKSFASSERLVAVTDALRSLYAQPEPQAHSEHFLGELCKHAVNIIDSAHMAGITVAESDSTYRTIAATDRLVHAVDAVQFRLETGPALDSGRTGTAIRAHSSEAGHRWPQFSCIAKVVGISSFLSVPIPGRDRPIGTLNLYSRSHCGFVGTDVALLQLLALTSSYTLHTSQRFARAQSRTRDLELALQSRAVIEQAKGIIMGTRHVDADHAFSILIQESQSTNIKLRVIAQQYIAAAVGTDPARAEIRDPKSSPN